VRQRYLSQASFGGNCRSAFRAGFFTGPRSTRPDDLFLPLPDVVDGRLEVRGVLGGGLCRFTEIGKVTETGKTVGYGMLRNSQLLRNFLLGMASQPQLEDAAIADLLGVLVDAGKPVADGPFRHLTKA
jgi:hypothetical protein